jgi:hypothetical protein
LSDNASGAREFLVFDHLDILSVMEEQQGAIEKDSPLSMHVVKWKWF